MLIKEIHSEARLKRHQNCLNLIGRKPELEDSRLFHDVCRNDDIAATGDDAEDGQSSGSIPVNIFGVRHPRSVPSLSRKFIFDDL